MSREIAIRRAQPADLDRLVELQLALQDHLEASNPDLWRMIAEARSQLKGQLAGRLAAPGSCVLVAEHPQDGVIGAIYGRIVTNSRYTPGRSGTVDQAFVEPAHRRQGVGMQLVAGLCGFFAEEGIEDLSLRYVAGNVEAAGFWAALGLTPRIVTVGAARSLVESQLRSG